MSLLAIIFIAVTIPFTIIFVAFTWFYIRSRFTQNRKTASIHPGYRPTFSPVPLSNINIVPGQPVHPVSSGIHSGYTTSYSQPITSYKPTYQPLSDFLDTSPDVIISDESRSTDYDIQYDLTVIPGISKQIEHGLHELGYTCIEQIARWGRADVRAVSAGLGIEQHRIEEEWIANARLIMSLK